MKICRMFQRQATTSTSTKSQLHGESILREQEERRVERQQDLVNEDEEEYQEVVDENEVVYEEMVAGEDQKGGRGPERRERARSKTVILATIMATMRNSCHGVGKQSRTGAIASTILPRPRNRISGPSTTISSYE